RCRGNGGEPGERGGQHALFVQDPQGARQFFSDENFSVGQKCQGPRRVQGVGKRGDGEGCACVEGSTRLPGEERLVIAFFRRARIDRLALRCAVDRPAWSKSAFW